MSSSMSVSFCIVSIARVRPSLNRTVGSAGEAGGEPSSASSSCRRYFMGERGFLGLDGGPFCAEGETGRFDVFRRTLGVSVATGWATAAPDMLTGDVRASSVGFWKKSSLVGEGDDREFCLAGDSEDSGSGIVSVRDIVMGGCSNNERRAQCEAGVLRKACIHEIAGCGL
jgi:hypothetical protein